MGNLLLRTSGFFAERVAPVLLRDRGTGDPGLRRELERQATAELEARISRGRPGPEEWHPGAKPAPVAPPPPAVVPDELRPVAIRVTLPTPATTSRVPSGSRR